MPDSPSSAVQQPISGPFRLQLTDLDAELSLYVHDERDRHVSERLRREGIWEPYETDLLRRILKPSAIMIDVGANIGYYTVLAASLVGVDGHVYAFEPEPDNFNLLEKNCAHNSLSNVSLARAALSDRQGKGQIYLNDSNLGDHQVYDDGAGRLSREIELLSGSAYLKPFVQRVDVIKVDTQGAEYQVLKGLQALIADSLPALHMIVEFWPAGLRRAGSSGDQLLDLLLSFKLDMQLIDHLGHSLIRCTEQDLRDWIRDVDADDSNEGFINLLLGTVDSAPKTCIDQA